MYASLFEKRNKKSRSDGYFEKCKKDFDVYKEIFLLSKVRNNEYRKSNSIIKEISHKENMNETHKNTFLAIDNFIKMGKDNVAFSLFFNTFPTCLPHRNLIKPYKF